MAQPVPLEDLIETHYGRVHRAAVLLCGCRWDADDLTQETFARAVEGWSGCRMQEEPFSWLYSILLNIDRSRRRRIWRWLKHQTGIALCRASSANSAEQDVDDGQVIDSLWPLVARLPVTQRQAIVMRYSEGWSNSQISELLGCQEVTVRTTVCKGLEKLRCMTRDRSAGGFRDDEKPVEVRLQSPPANPSNTVMTWNTNDG